MSRGNTPIAERLDHVIRSMPDDVAIGHRDLIPRALFVRVAASMTGFVHLLESSSGRSLGLVERGGDPWDAPSSASLRAIVRACLGDGVLPVLESTADIPECPILGLVEVTCGTGTFRLYLDLGAFTPPRPSPSPRDGSLPLGMTIRVGSTRLPVGDLRPLSLGDLVTIDDYHPAAPRGSVDGIPLLYEFAMDDDRLIHRGATAHDDDEDVDLDDCVTGSVSLELRADDDLAPIDSAVVTIQLELARIATTVGELDALVPGAILATGLPDGKRVTLRIGGRAIARGEMVDHDGEPAVRILELASRA